MNGTRDHPLGPPPTWNASGTRRGNSDAENRRRPGLRETRA